MVFRVPAPGTCLSALVLLLLCTAPALGEDAPGAPPQPFVGIGPLEVGSHWDRDATHLEALGGAGRTLLHVAPLAWGEIEPAPPQAGRARYRWQDLDQAVLYWQLADFDPVLVLSPRSPWAAVPRKKSAWLAQVAGALPEAESAAAGRAATGACALRKDTWLLWERFVRDLVERYDGDGKGDMPGLRRPLRHIQILERASSPRAWIGSEEEYLRLLHHAGLGAHNASTTCRVLAAPIDLLGTGHAPYPDKREWDYRIDQLVPKDARLARMRTQRSFSLIRRLLETPHLYDVLPQLGAESVHDDVANLRFLRRALAEQEGGDEVGLWLVENAPRKLGPARAPGHVAPRKEEHRVRGRWIPAARSPAHSEFSAANKWMRTGQAFDLVRGLCRALEAGAEAVLFLSPGDELPVGWPRRSELAGLGFLALSGTQKDPRLERTPSWWALQQARSRLIGYGDVKSTALGTPGRHLRFGFGSGQDETWVGVLLLDARLSWAGEPGKPLPVRDVLVALPDGDYVLESVRLGPAQPMRKRVSVTGGALVVALTPAPIYVLPLR